MPSSPNLFPQVDLDKQSASPWKRIQLKSRFIPGLPASLSLTAAIALLMAQPVYAANVIFNFKIQASGTAPFDGDNTAGNDASATNDVVRSQDVITYKWEYAINNGAANNVILRAIVPSNVELIMPAVCTTGSQITTNPATGAQTIDCAIGTLASGSSGNIDLKARVLGKNRAPGNQFVGNGDITSSIGSISGSNIVNPIAPITTPTLTISAKPKVDLYKQSAYVEGVAKGDDGVTDGLVIRYPIVMALTGGGKGGEALIGDLKFTDSLIYNGGPNDGQGIPGAKLYSWRPGYYTSITPGTNSSCNRMGGDPWAYYGGYPNGKINSSEVPSYGEPDWSTTDSGNWTCTQAGPGQPIQVTIAGSDTTGNRAPVRDYYGGTVLPTDQRFLVVGAVHLWVPLTAIQNNGGQLNVRNNLTAFTAKGASGQPNQEPTLTNNYYDHTLVSTSGSFTSHYATDVDNRGTPLPGMSAIYGGDGVVMPTQTYTDRVYLSNNGAIAWATGAILCTAIDNKIQEVVALSDTPDSAVRNFSSAGLGTKYVIEYGTGNYATVSDHKKATCRDQDSPDGWTSDIRTVVGGADAITKVRVRAIQDIPPGDTWDIAVNLRTRNYYVGTTTKIPNGTLLVQHSSIYIKDWAGIGQGEPGMPTDWYGGYYQRDINYYVGWGDRLTLTRAVVRVDKQNIPNQAVVNAIAGAEVPFILKPSITAPVPTSLASNVILKDTLPANLDYKAGSANIPPTTIVNNPDGTQLLTWNLGARVPGQPLPEITYKTVVRPDAANNSTATNTVVIDSPDDASLESARTDRVDVTIGNTAAFKIFKEVDQVLLEPNQIITYSLFYANTGGSDVGTSQFIDVLPYPGDEHTPKTNYTGSLSYSTITGSHGETFEFTSQPVALINSDPADPSNQAGGATQWCSGFGLPGCPSDNSSVTGIRINAPIFPKETPTRVVRLSMKPNGNQKNDFYTNSFTGRASGLLGLLQSNDVFSKVRIPANLTLVKRITEVNRVPITSIVDDPSSDNDNAPAWPTGYLTGAIDGGVVKPGDELEYTIYFLSDGDSPVTNAMLCDLVPSNVTYLPTGFNGLGPPGSGGLSGADRGIQLNQSTNTTYLTGVGDGDAGTFVAAGTMPTTTCAATNGNGAVTIQLGNITQSGYGGNRDQAYGLIRFRAKVK
jgi:uncharacterized repeat protein (TIGR01451 family)